VFSFLVKNKKH